MNTLTKLAGGAAVLFAISAVPASADSYDDGPGYYTQHTVCDPDGRHCYSSYTRQWSYNGYNHRGYRSESYRDDYQYGPYDDGDSRAEQAYRYYRNGDQGYRNYDDRYGPDERHYGDRPYDDRDSDDDDDGY